MPSSWLLNESKPFLFFALSLGGRIGAAGCGRFEERAVTDWRRRLPTTLPYWTRLGLPNT
jgi:hypothetical protein